MTMTHFTDRETEPQRRIKFSRSHDWQIVLIPYFMPLAQRGAETKGGGSSYCAQTFYYGRADCRKEKGESDDLGLPGRGNSMCDSQRQNSA